MDSERAWWGKFNGRFNLGFGLPSPSEATSGAVACGGLVTWVIELNYLACAPFFVLFQIHVWMIIPYVPITCWSHVLLHCDCWTSCTWAQPCLAAITLDFVSHTLFLRPGCNGPWSHKAHTHLAAYTTSSSSAPMTCVIYILLVFTISICFNSFLAI